MDQISSYMGWKVDFATPIGAPAYLAPDSVQWRVFKNPIALGVGGVAAVLLEFADPRIRSGVWDHSTYKADPIGRSRRTGMAAMVGVYGPKEAARRVIQGVTNMHARVGGETPGGRAYQALDPELLDWVSATAAYGFVTAYHRFVAPLSAAEHDAFYREGEAIGKLYGVQQPIRSSADFMAMMDRLAPGLRAAPDRRGIPRHHRVRPRRAQRSTRHPSGPGPRLRLAAAAAGTPGAGARPRVRPEGR